MRERKETERQRQKEHTGGVEVLAAQEKVSIFWVRGVK